MVKIGDRILVANRDTGSVSMVDLESAQILSETVVSQRLDDLAAVEDEGIVFGVDSRRHVLIEMQLEESAVRKTGETVVDQFPVSVAVSSRERIVSVVSKWSRRVTLLKRATTSEVFTVSAVIDIPFVSLKQLFLDGRFLLVAAAHGGELAIVDTVQQRLFSHQTLIGHNIRGMALTADGRNCVLSHQIMNSASSTTRSTISWGGVISNTLHLIPVDQLKASQSTVTSESIHGSLFPLGSEGRAAGDPASLAVAADGRVYVALSGVHEVAMRWPGSRELIRTSVARRPVELILDEQSDRLYALCMFDDSIVILDAKTLERRSSIRLDSRLNESTVARSHEQMGEELFFDARLSLDGWYSCHSCHSDGHSTGLLNDNLGDETFNTPKRILTLLGTADTEPWAWSGAQVDLRNQVRKSIESTMAGPGRSSPEITDREIESIVAYISSFEPPPGISIARGSADRPAVSRGHAVFKKHGCSDCHAAPRYTYTLAFDVGLRDEGGIHFFNPPSLLGVSQRGPYFHDNRARTLMDVLLEHDHDGASSLSDDDVRDLVEFLNSL